jgi:hypothetical protein
MFSFDCGCKDKNNEMRGGGISINTHLSSQNTENNLFKFVEPLNGLYIPTGLIMDSVGLNQTGGSHNITTMKEVGILETELFDHLFNSVCVVKKNKNKNKTVKKKKHL